MTHILSVDAGTTATKAALFDINGRLTARSMVEYRLETPSSLEVEVDAETLWTAFKKGIHEVLRSRVDPADIKAIGISAQGETLIPIDREGNSIRRAIVWLDSRAQAEARRLDEEFGAEQCYQVTGQVKMVPTWPASKIFWIKKHEPKIFADTWKYLLVEDYLIYRMTGNCVAEGSLLCSTAYWNIRTKKWWNDMLDFIGITPDQLPEIRESGEIVDTLSDSIAEELGLRNSTLVCTGALDQAAGAVGVGNIREGLFSENTGGALGICAPLEQFRNHPKSKMPIHYFVKPDTYMVHTFTTGGIVLKWFRDSFCQPEIQLASNANLDPYEIMINQTTKISPGSEGLTMLPHLQGAMAPESNPQAKGVFYGFTLRHTKQHFVRAIMEAIVCVVRRNIDALHDMNIRVNEIRALGGGAKSKVWKQIEADFTKIPVAIFGVEENEACLGAAILASKASGLYKSVDDACAKMVRIKERFTPNRENFEAYDALYLRYQQLYNDLCDQFERDLSEQAH
ncbi:MAG: xylulokinase [Candidatus Bathyarchaeia archaeon]